MRYFPPVIFVSFFILILSFSYQPVYGQDFLSGFVLDLSGFPIEDAEVSAWVNDELIDVSYTDSSGIFAINHEAEIITVFADDNSTKGIDYLPALIDVSSVDQIEFYLHPAFTVKLTGNVQYVESNELPLSIVYRVVDIENKTISPSGYPLVFGSQSGYGPYNNRYIGSDEIIFPSETDNLILVNASILINRQLSNRIFLMEPQQSTTGSETTLDIRKFLIPHNLLIIEELRHNVENQLEEMNSLGFFLTKQQSLYSSGVRSSMEAHDLHFIGEYTSSFQAAKKSYIDLIKTSEELDTLFSDASYSVYILIFFLTLTGTSIAQMLTNTLNLKFIASFIAVFFFLAILYLVYPGSVIIPINNFIIAGFISLISTLIISLFLPQFMKGGSVDAHVPVRNIILPIFSIAKRSLNRRTFRFILTLLSITVLVSSFVSLTSFSEGYGLTLNQISNKENTEGVLIRDGSWSSEEIAFLPFNEAEFNWLVNQPESQLVSPKFENLPQLTQITTLNGLPIRGIISIDPLLENQILELHGTLLEGSLISESGIMISDELQKNLKLDIGDMLLLGEIELELQAVFQGQAFSDLRDLDSETYLPQKIVNTNIGGERPILAPKECKPEEIVVIHVSKAKYFPTLGVERISVLTLKGVDETSFAERIALERGYKVWASSESGVVMAQIGSYLEGKGLPLIIPWAIVVLNVIITMLNSLYERRNEISTLSSVGLNPAQISSIFVAEALIIGLIAGGTGYIVGLSSYKLVSLMGATLEVHQKVSAFWSIASIGLAISAVLAGALVSLRSSVVITPSLMRRWRMEGSENLFNKPLNMEIPVKLTHGEKEAFLDFILTSLNRRRHHPDKVTSQIKVLDDEDTTIINFVYRSHISTTGNFYTKNSLIIEPRGEGFSVNLQSQGEVEWVREIGSIVRMMAMEWSTRGS